MAQFRKALSRNRLRLDASPSDLHHWLQRQLLKPVSLHAQLPDRHEWNAIQRDVAWEKVLDLRFEWVGYHLATCFAFAAKADEPKPIVVSREEVLLCC